MTAISPFFVAQQERECDLNDVREAARKLARNFDLAYWRKCDKEEKYPWDFVNSFAKAGWMGILMPEEYGGMGLGVTEASIMLQEVAAVGGMSGGSAIHFYVFPPQPILRPVARPWFARWTFAIPMRCRHRSIEWSTPSAEST